MTRVIQVNFSDSDGGAARAARRLNQALNQAGGSSRMVVINKTSDDITVQAPLGFSGRMRALMAQKAGKLALGAQRTTNPVVHSLNWCPSGLGKWIDRCDAEVVNLHWLGFEALSVGEVAAIRKPLVWTMHDMWSFCGAEHYSDDAPGSRFETGFHTGNRVAGHGGLDLDRWTWRRKQSAWQRPFHVVSPSRWLGECVKRSKLMTDWPVSVIPNALDTELFAPLPDKSAIRRLLKLPDDRQLIAFGAVGGGSDPRKGFDLLLAALRQLADKDKERYACVVFGQSQPAKAPDIGLPIHWMGRLHDEISVAIVYNAVDVMVVPSRQENLPQTGTEALACGCPVAAFDCTGMPDIVEHRVTGYLARAYEANDLAVGIEWILADTVRHRELSANARKRAVSLWSTEVVVPQYLDLYRKLSA